MYDSGYERPGHRPPASLNDTLDDVAGHLNAQYGRLIDATVELLAKPALWQGDGVWTIEGCLAWRCGISRSTAGRIAALARRVDELPETFEAVRVGELSLDQADPIARHCPPWADTQVATLARNITVTQIRRLLEKYPWPEPETGHVGAADDTLLNSGARPKPPGAPPPIIAGTWKHPIGARLNTWWLDIRSPTIDPPIHAS
jgi:hypothetical protein